MDPGVRDQIEAYRRELQVLHERVAEERVLLAHVLKLLTEAQDRRERQIAAYWKRWRV